MYFTKRRRLPSNIVVVKVELNSQSSFKIKQLRPCYFCLSQQLFPISQNAPNTVEIFGETNP
jgi:hypothetical protein